MARHQRREFIRCLLAIIATPSLQGVLIVVRYVKTRRRHRRGPNASLLPTKAAAGTLFAGVSPHQQIAPPCAELLAGPGLRPGPRA
jgi:hypothetical protein